MPREHLGNQFATILTDAVTYLDDTIRVADASGFPELQFRVRIGNEILIVYEALPDLHSFKVIRGAENSNPAAHSQNSAVTIVATAGGMEQWLYDSYSEIPHGTVSDPEWRFLNTQSGLVYLDDAGSGFGTIAYIADSTEAFRSFQGGIGIPGNIVVVGDIADEADYPVNGSGGGGSRRFLAPMTGLLEDEWFSFQNVLPGQGSTLQVLPSQNYKPTAIRLQDFASPAPQAGGYFEIKLDSSDDEQVNWAVQFSSLIKSPPPVGPEPSPPMSFPLQFAAGDGIKMVIGKTGQGVTVGRHSVVTGMPNAGYFTVQNGIEVGPGILGAGPGDGYFERNVRALSVAWGLDYSRTEILNDFNEEIASGAYVADDIPNPPQSDRSFLVQNLYDPDEGVSAQIAFDENDSNEIYVRVRGGTGPTSWWRVLHQGNTLPVVGGSGIFPGPIGIGTLADLTDKDNGDLIVYNSITVANEPGGLFGEIVTPHGSFKTQAGFHGVVVSDNQLTPKRARFGVQRTDGIFDTRAAWMSYGAYPDGTDGPIPSDSSGYVWRLGPRSLPSGRAIVAELLTGGGSTWVPRFTMLASGILEVGNGITAGFGGIVSQGDITGPNLYALGPETIIESHASFGVGLVRARSDTKSGHPRFEWVWNPAQSPPDPPPPLPRTYTAAINRLNGYLEILYGTAFEPSGVDAPNPRIMRFDWNSSVGIYTNPSGTPGDLSVGYSINVASTGAAAGEVLAQYLSSSVTISSAARNYHRFWASYGAANTSNVSIGFNVSGKDQLAPVRDDTTKPSWLVRFGEQDSFEILRAAPGGGSPWLQMLLLDSDGNLTSIGDSSLFSAINVGEALGAGLGEIRMSGSLYLSRQTTPSSTDQKIMVDTSTSDPRAYAPFFEAAGALWIVRGPGIGGGRLQTRVGASDGTFEIATTDGSTLIATVGNTRLLQLNAGVTIGVPETDFPVAAINDLHIKRRVRAGVGSLSLPAYSFWGVIESGPSPAKAGMFFEYTPEDGGNVNIATITMPGDTVHRTMEITPKRVRVNTNLVPLTGDAAIDSHYNLGGFGFQAWRYGFFHRGLTIGGRPEMASDAYAKNSQLRIYGQFDGMAVDAPQYLIHMVEDSAGAALNPPYSSSIMLVGQGYPTRPTMELGITYLPADGTIEGYLYTDRFEGRPTHFLNISRGDFIIGIGGNRRFHMNRFGSLGIGNVDPTEPDPGDPDPPNVLGDMSIAKSLIVGAVNASASAGGSEGEIIASKLTLVAGSDPDLGGAQFNTPIILANNVPIQGRLSATGDAYDLFWINPLNDVYLRGTPDRKVVFQTVHDDGLGGEIIESVMHLWPNNGVVIGPYLVATPEPPPGGLRVDGDLELGAALILGPDTTIFGLQFTDPDIPFIGVGLFPTEVPQMALLSQGQLAWGPGGSTATWDVRLSRRSAGLLEVNDRLYVEERVGVGLTAVYALDVETQTADAWVARFKNLSAHGDGLLLQAGSDGTDTVLRIDQYPTANVNLLLMDGAGGVFLNGNLAVTDSALPDPFHPSTTRKGEIRCEYIVVRNSTNYQFASGGTIDIEDVGITLGNNIPLRAKDATNTARALLWVDTGNLTHLRSATATGLVIETSAAAVALRIGSAGSVATGLNTPSANQGDLSVGRGLNVGSGVSGASNGQVIAAELVGSSTLRLRVSGSISAVLIGSAGAVSIGPYTPSSNLGDLTIGRGLGVGGVGGYGLGQVAAFGPRASAGLWISTNSGVTDPSSPTATIYDLTDINGWAGWFENYNTAGGESPHGLYVQTHKTGAGVTTLDVRTGTGGGVFSLIKATGDGRVLINNAAILHGLVVGNATADAADGEIKAISAHFTGNVVIDGTLSAASAGGGTPGDVTNLFDGTLSLPSVRWLNSQHMGIYRVADNVMGYVTNSLKRMEIGVGVGIGMSAPVTAGDLAVNRSLMVGTPTGATTGQVAANQLLSQNAGANLVPSAYLQQFGVVISGTDQTIGSSAAKVTEAASATKSAASRSASLLLLNTGTAVGQGAGVLFGVGGAASYTGDPVFAEVRGLPYAGTGSGSANSAYGVITFSTREAASAVNMTERMRITGTGVGIGGVPGGFSEDGDLLVARGLNVGSMSNWLSAGSNGIGQMHIDKSLAIGSFSPSTLQGDAYIERSLKVGTGAWTGSAGWISAGVMLVVGALGIISTPLGQLSSGVSVVVGVASNYAVGLSNSNATGHGLYVTVAGITASQRIAAFYNGSAQEALVVLGDKTTQLYGPVDFKAQASPGSPTAGFVRIFPDANGALKAKTSTGEEWPLALRDSGVINGDFDVWQLGSIFTGLTASAYIADHWQTTQNLGNLTVQRTSDRPTATQQGGHYAQYCLEVISTVAVASIPATGLVAIRQPIEGRHWQRYVGRPTVISFWAKSNRVNQFFSVAYRSGVPGARFVVNAFQLTVADTWQFFWFAMPAPPSLFDFNYDHQLGAEFFIVLAAGSNYWTNQPPIWQVGTALASSAQTNFLSTVSAYLRLSHIKIENGESASPCTGKPWHDVLHDTQRYIVKTFPYDTVPAVSAGTAGALGASLGALPGVISWRLPSQMRTSPTVTTFNPSGAGAAWSTGHTALVSGTSMDGAIIQTNSGAASAAVAMIHATANADFALI